MMLLLRVLLPHPFRHALTKNQLAPTHIHISHNTGVNISCDDDDVCGKICARGAGKFLHNDEQSVLEMSEMLI